MKAKIFLLSACLLLAAGLDAAQQPLAPGPRFQPGPVGPTPDPVRGNLFPPELIMRNQKAIGLTDEQKTTIRGELLQAQTRFTELQWELQDQVESLVSLLKQEKVDEQQALAQLDKVLDVEREIKRAQIGLMVRIKNKLTPEQQAQLREIRGRGFPGRRLPPGPRPQ
jgi:Spy/CpxP family protein refolding chaperone